MTVNCKLVKYLTHLNHTKCEKYFKIHFSNYNDTSKKFLAVHVNRFTDIKKLKFFI
jgi:hypothetical protein